MALNRRMLDPSFAKAYGVGSAGGGAVIKAVHSFSGSASSGAGANLTIPAVDVNNAFIMTWNWRTSTTTNHEQAVCAVELFDSTTVKAYQFNGTQCDVRGIVVEYEPGVIKSIQTGTSTNGANTIAAVDLNKAIPFYNGNTYDLTFGGGATLDHLFSRLELTSTTNLQVSAPTDGDGINTTYWAVVEFNL